MRIFDGRANGSNAEFSRWLVETPNGYFANITGAETGYLHRGNCPHMVFSDPDAIDFVKTPKWVADTADELRAESARAGIVLTACDTRKCSRV